MSLDYLLNLICELANITKRTIDQIRTRAYLQNLNQTILKNLNKCRTYPLSYIKIRKGHFGLNFDELTELEEILKIFPSFWPDLLATKKVKLINFHNRNIELAKWPK
jgi:hypothetical protein